LLSPLSGLCELFANEPWAEAHGYALAPLSWLNRRRLLAGNIRKCSDFAQTGAVQLRLSQIDVLHPFGPGSLCRCLFCRVGWNEDLRTSFFAADGPGDFQGDDRSWPGSRSRMLAADSFGRSRIVVRGGQTDPPVTEKGSRKPGMPVNSKIPFKK